MTGPPADVIAVPQAEKDTKDTEESQEPSFVLKQTQEIEIEVQPAPQSPEEKQPVVQITKENSEMPRTHQDNVYSSLEESSLTTTHYVEMDAAKVQTIGERERAAAFEYRISLTRKQILYLVIMQGVGSFALNFGINFLVAWLIYRNIDRIPLAGNLTCIISDVAVTSFAITFLTCLIGTVLVRNDVKAGKIVTAADKRWLLAPMYKFVPTGSDWKSLLLRSVELGLIATLVYTLPTELVMIGAARNGMQIKWAFCIFKGLWGGIEGGLVGPYTALIALATL